MNLPSDNLFSRSFGKSIADLRRSVLIRFGASPREVDELLHYNEASFDLDSVATSRFPLADELFVEEWDTYATEATKAGSITAIFPFLPQLQFPVQSELGNRPEYIDAVKRGKFSFPEGIATGLNLEEPHRCRLFLHPTDAGRIPVIVAGSRADFIALIRAFTKKGEPDPVPESMGAIIIGGYNNFRRIHRLRDAHLEKGETEQTWADRFIKIQQQKDLYQDRFIILGTGAYSGVPAAALGIEEESWHAISLAIRLGHECTHYFTRRVFGSMRNNLIDELIADYCGLDNAVGEYPAQWALHFLGLEDQHTYRPGGRLENYLARQPLSEAAVRVLALLVRAAIENLRRLNLATASWRGNEAYRVASIFTLAAFTLECLAMPRAWEDLTVRFDECRRLHSEGGGFAGS